IAAEAEEVPVVGVAMAETPVPEEETTETSAQTGNPIVTVGGDMNVRSGPGEEYDRIGGAFAGEAFAITGKNADGDWWQIDFDGQDGWLYAPFVTATDADNVPVVGSSMEETPAPATGTETAEREAEGPVVTIGGDMNIRQGPGTDFARIGGAFEGEEYGITGKSADGEWWQIDFDGEAGWVYAAFVTATNAGDVPTVEAPRAQTPVAAPGPSGAGQAPGVAVATVGEDVNVRNGPGTEYDRIGGATAGEAYTITGKSADGEWWQIDFAGQSGWIYGPLVTATDAEDVPVVTPTTDGVPAESNPSTAVALGSGGYALGVQFEEE
ncbi:MAG: SH3 domain-containing protein, partial [Caldilineaceae bacterium]|nr:SH3 domain-containing protein [Caldilineaceae bacterium]